METVTYNSQEVSTSGREESSRLQAPLSRSEQYALVEHFLACAPYNGVMNIEYILFEVSLHFLYDVRTLGRDNVIQRIRNRGSWAVACEHEIVQGLWDSLDHEDQDLCVHRDQPITLRDIEEGLSPNMKGNLVPFLQRELTYDITLDSDVKVEHRRILYEKYQEFGDMLWEEPEEQRVETEEIVERKNLCAKGLNVIEEMMDSGITETKYEKICDVLHHLNMLEWGWSSSDTVLGESGAAAQTRKRECERCLKMFEGIMEKESPKLTEGMYLELCNVFKMLYEI